MVKTSANQLAGFYMIGTLVVKGLKNLKFIRLTAGCLYYNGS